MAVRGHTLSHVEVRRADFQDLVFERRLRSPYNEPVITRGIRELVGRDWAAVRRVKDSYWAERIARLGAAEGFRIADELRRQARLQHPGWPTAAERREDLAAHARLVERFQRARSARRP